MHTLSIGARLAALRTGKRLTQRALAQQLGVSDKSVSKWERDISCPDVTLLPQLAQVLGTTVDAILTGAVGDVDGVHPFLSTEKYLMGEYGYVTPDLHPTGERAVLLLDAPSPEDAIHGVALTGSMGVAAAQALYGEIEPLGWRMYREGGILGVTYVSSVPLLPPDASLSPLTAELEGIRLGRYEIHRYLHTCFQTKVCELIEREDIERIAMTREFNQKYFFTALAQASPRVVRHFSKRVSEGSLRLLFVGIPTFTWLGKERGGELFDFPELRNYIRSFL